MAPPKNKFDEQTDAQGDPFGYPLASLRRKPRVTWTDADGAHTAHVEGRMVVGSASAVDLVVADAGASRLHAELELREDGLWVQDLGSRNGTFVEGVQVRSARVPEGGKVRVGMTSLLVQYAPTPTPVALWPTDSFGPLIGRSQAMRELFLRLDRIAATDSTVLIHGETGTGKELVAQAIHGASPRAANPFVIVDCTALPETLLESELFGHAKGAFTGANSARAGAIEMAEGGTVFLDEIGELPLSMQPKLLRAIESRGVRRVGEGTYRKVDFRLVSATHRDLKMMVNEGAFREDLYFRLAVVPITVPPLRARLDDVPLLVEHFLPERDKGTLHPDLLTELSDKPWLGNVRELRNFVERALALGAAEALEAVSAADPRSAKALETFPSVSVEEPFRQIRERWLDHLEREYIKQLLVVHRRNISAVAHAAGLDRSWVHKLIRKHDL